MKKTALLFRCVPRYGFERTEIRLIDLEVPPHADEEALHNAVQFYFASRGIADALYDIAVDDDGFFAVINDEVYDEHWGRPLR